MSIEPERIETAIAALENIGPATPADLHPSPEKMSKNEIHSIVREHTINIAKLQTWLDILDSTPLEEFDLRMFLLNDLLNHTTQQASSVIMSLGLVN